MNTGYQPLKTAALFTVIAAILLYPLLLLSAAISTGSVTPAESISYAFMDKSSLSITMESVSPQIKAVTADTENTLVVRVQVRNAAGKPVKGAGIRLDAVSESADAAASTAAASTAPAATETPAASTAAVTENSAGDTIPIGSFLPSSGITDANGSFLAEYVPPASTKGVLNVDLLSHLSGTDKIGSIHIKLVPVPVVLVHGYQASPEIFSGVSAYLKAQSFSPLSISYTSQNGVAASASELSAFLDKKKAELSSKGIQVKRFDLITHSMGGLVARYYTCSSDYSDKGNIRKLIFVSVPQRGSPFAAIGLKYYDDQGIRDLVTESSLYSGDFPSMTNGGLNPSIQTGSIMGRFDEVVSIESASLAEWNIKTELFDVGDSNFTIDKLLSGEILQAANHKLILYNKKVYERLVQMLDTDLPLPSAE